MNYPDFRPGMGFGVPDTTFNHKNPHLRFFERIYVVYDVMNDKSVKYWKIEVISKPDQDPTIPKGEETIMVDSKNLFHCDIEVFEGILKSANAQEL